MILRIFFGIFFLLLPTNFAWFYGRPDPGLMTQGGVWPLPKTLNYNNESLAIDPSAFLFNSWKPGCEILDKALQRYKKLSFPGYGNSSKHFTSKANSIASVTITLKNGCTSEYPQFNMDESYTIHATSSIGIIMANEIWGALRALETFSHLIYKDTNGQWWLRAATISDSPRFPHRGIMLDSSRHYLSVNILKRQIDLMAQNKMNVFHWHLTDSEAFPYTSSMYPNMSLKGAYTPKHIYTVNQIKDIIEFSRLRGIRVIPEFDSPGHTGAWHGFKGLLSLCYDHTGANNILSNIIDPTKDANWEFLTNFFGEALDLFKDNYFHFGGDEVSDDMLYCWQRNSDVMNWMNANGMGTDTNKLLNYYFQKLVKLVQNHKSSTNMVFWQEVLDMNVAPQDSIAHVWKGGTMDEVNPIYQ
jgi:hexosaminidase